MKRRKKRKKLKLDRVGNRGPERPHRMNWFRPLLQFPVISNHITRYPQEDHHLLDTAQISRSERPNIAEVPHRQHILPAAPSKRGPQLELKH